MAAIPFLNSITLNKNELQLAVVQVLAADPSSPVEGQIYYNSVSKKLRQYNGSTWTEYIDNTGAGDVSQASNSGGAGRMKISAGANKIITDLSGVVGLIKTDTNGVVSAAASGTDYAPATSGTSILKGNGSGGFSNAVAGTDYVTGSSSNTFTNKTIDANGTGNSISNLETADFATNVVDTDGTLAANSDTRLASQKAVKTYVDGKVTGLLDYQGAIDASANPNYPAASKGDVYRISVAGKIGGASGLDVQVGDEIIANADNAGGTQASVGSSWDIVQANLNPASTTVAGYVELATQAETEAKSSSTLAVTPASLATFTRKVTATIGDGSTTAIAVTDNLGTVDKIAILRSASGEQVAITDITYATNTTTFTFAVAPATNSYDVVIIG